MKGIIVAVPVIAGLWILLALGGRSQAAELSTRPAKVVHHALPVRITVLQELSRGKKPSEVAALIVKMFGPPNRDIGSGLTILQWNVDGGELLLTVEWAKPPIFRYADGAEIWLVDSQNPIGQSIVAQFEMGTPPDPKNHGTQFPLGEVSLKADGTYEYIPSRPDRVTGYFFPDNAHGTYTVAYPAGLTSHSLLEDLPDNACAATGHFSAGATTPANQPVPSLDLKVCASSDRWLHLVSADQTPLNCRLDAPWRNVWGNSSTFKWDYDFPKPSNAP